MRPQHHNLFSLSTTTERGIDELIADRRCGWCIGGPGLEMLEHIISQTPARVFQDEDVGDCVRAVLELCNCSAGAGYPALETQMVGALDAVEVFISSAWTCGRSLLSAFRVAH